MSLFLQALVQGIMLGGVYALVALGLVLICKATKVINLAYGEIMMVMAYLMSTFFVAMGLNLVLSIFLVLVISALTGLLLERFTMRPLVGQGFLSMVIVTLVIGVFSQGVVTIAWSGREKSLSMIPQGAVSLGDIRIEYTYLWAFFIAMLVFGLMVFVFRYTRVGLAMRAVAEDHQLSQAMGIGVKRIFAISWAISCVAAAIAGLLLGNISLVSPSMGYLGLAKALPVLLLGGLESIPGALLGGIIVGVVEIVGGAYAGGQYGDIIPFTLMLLILLIRPYGLFGLRTIERI